MQKKKTVPFWEKEPMHRGRKYTSHFIAIGIIVLIYLIINYYSGTTDQKNSTDRKINHVPTLDAEWTEDHAVFRKTFLHDKTMRSTVENLESWCAHFNSLPPRNQDKFQLEKDFLPILLRIDDSNQLRQTLESLKAVQHIGTTLLIVSIGYLSDEISAAVDSIDFCQVKELLFPYSEQLILESYMEQENLQGFFGFTESRTSKIHWLWSYIHAFEHTSLQLSADLSSYSFNNLVYVEAKLLARSRYSHYKESCFGAMLGAPYSRNATRQKTIWGHCELECVVDDDPIAFLISRPIWAQIADVYALYCEANSFSWSGSLYSAMKELLISRTYYGFVPIILKTSFPRAVRIRFCENRKHNHFSATECVHPNDYKAEQNRYPIGSLKYGENTIFKIPTETLYDATKKCEQALKNAAITKDSIPANYVQTCKRVGRIIEFPQYVFWNKEKMGR